MAALTAVSVTAAGATPAPVAVASSDTIAASQFGPNGCIIRVINAGGSPDSFTVSDPTLTDLGNTGSPAAVSVPNGQTRMIFIPKLAINQATQLATVNHSFTTSVTCELYSV